MSLPTGPEQPPKQFGGGNLERVSEALKVVDRQVGLATLDVADEGPVQTGLMRQRFLGPAKRQPGAADIGGRDAAQYLPAFGHGPNFPERRF